MTFALERIDTFVVRLPGRADFRWLSLSRPLGEFVLLRIEAGGVEGWGEVVPLRDWGDRDGRRHGETPATVNAIVHGEFAPWLLANEVELGELARGLDALVVGNPYAKALVDMAAHDLAGKLLGVPVRDLLGGAARRSVRVAHMLGLMPADEALAEARAAVADGILALQVKGGQSAERDASLVQALRDEHGDALWLRLDANGGYRGRTQARRALDALADAGADMVEQPTLGLADLAEARRESRVPIMADEGCWSPADAVELVASRAVDALSVYACKPGGLARARSVCSIAAAAELPHDVNGSLELGIGNAANLQLALASPAELLPCVIPINAPAGQQTNTTAGRYFEDDVVRAPFRYADGELLPLEGPGLGIEVDVEKVERYCVDRRSTPDPAGD